MCKDKVQSYIVVAQLRPNVQNQSASCTEEAAGDCLHNKSSFCVSRPSGMSNQGFFFLTVKSVDQFVDRGT